MPLPRPPAYRGRLAAFLLLLLAGCGSSGGGTTVAGPTVFVDPNVLLDGVYQFVGFSGEADGVETMSALAGVFTADGAGNAEFSAAINELGVITPAGPPSPVDYQVHVDHSLTMGSFGPGAAYLRGGVTSTGDLAMGAVVFDGSDPFLWLMGRPTSSMPDDTNVLGTWRFTRYTANIAVPLNVAGWGTIEFDGMGAGTYEESNNQEGATFGPINPPFTYEVLPDGQIALALGGANVIHGSVIAGEQVIIAAGSSIPGGAPSIYVFVRAAVGMSDADLAGEYSMVSFGHESAANSYATFTGGVMADGAGVNQFVGMRNEDGVTTTSGFDGVLSSVAPDGAVTFTTGGGDQLHGAISADGSVVIGAGTSTPGGDPAFFLFLR